MRACMTKHIILINHGLKEEELNRYDFTNCTDVFYSFTIFDKPKILAV